MIRCVGIEEREFFMQPNSELIEGVLASARSHPQSAPSDPGYAPALERRFRHTRQITLTYRLEFSPNLPLSTIASPSQVRHGDECSTHLPEEIGPLPCRPKHRKMIALSSRSPGRTGLRCWIPSLRRERLEEVRFVNASSGRPESGPQPIFRQEWSKAPERPPEELS